MPRWPCAGASARASRLVGPPQADFAFIDLADGKRWTLRINDGRLPWWTVRCRSRRVPALDRDRIHRRWLPLLWAGKDKTVGDVIDCTGPVYDRLAAIRCCSPR